MANQANVVQNDIARAIYLVDANGNPISISNPMGVNATFSASSLAINDPTTTANKATVDGSGNLHVSAVGSGAAGTPAGGVLSIQGVASGTPVPISGTISATNPSVSTDGSAIPTSSTLIGASDGTNLQQLLVESSSNRNLRTALYNGANEASVSAGGALKVDNSGVTQPVSASSLPLPTGAATSAKQPALGTAGSASTDVISVQGIASMTALKVDGSGVTQPVNGTVTANAQQADLSTTGTISAAQPVINTPVSSATVVIALGQGQSTWKAQLLAGGGGFTSATTIVADKSPDGGTTWYSASFKVSGAVANTPVSSVVGPGPLELTGNAAGISHVRIRCSALNSTETVAVTLRGGVGIGDIGLLSPIPAGSNLIGGVNIVDSAGTNKLAVDGSGRVTEASAASISTNTSTTATNTGNIPAKGQSTMANSTPVTMASNQSNINVAVNAALPAGSAVIGSTTIQAASGTALAADVSNSELRVSNYVKSSAAGDTALTLGQATMANSLPVTLASDQTPKTSGTATRSNVAGAASDTSLLASNTSRKGALFYNDSTAILYLAYGASAASTTSYTVQVPANGFFELPLEPIYTGAIRGIWSAANGNVRITELS